MLTSGLSDVSLSIINTCYIYNVENIYFIAYLGRCEQVWEVCEYMETHNSLSQVFPVGNIPSTD